MDRSSSSAGRLGFTAASASARASRAALYRRRFSTARPPLWPSPSLRTLTSATEVAHLIDLPGASMKGVPAQRIALPRLPAPAEAERAAIVAIPTPPS
jgi:hypothetical protein